MPESTIVSVSFHTLNTKSKGNCDSYLAAGTQVCHFGQTGRGLIMLIVTVSVDDVMGSKQQSPVLSESGKYKGQINHVDPVLKYSVGDFLLHLRPF